MAAALLPRAARVHSRSSLAAGRVYAIPLIILGALLPVTPPANATATYASDNYRTGWYPDQASLSPALVGGGGIGQLFNTTVTGAVFGQPLVANGVLLVVTEANWIYGLNPVTGATLWSRQVGVPWDDRNLGCGDIVPSVGITCTPVIDETTNTAYFVAKTYKNGSSGAAALNMHAISLADGTEKSGFPVLITGYAQNNPGVAFDATHQTQRPGLLLMQGIVYAGYSSVCDVGHWQGWIIGVSTAGQIISMWVDQQLNDDGAGIWQSGDGLISDGLGRIFFSTGNNNSPTTPIPGNAPPVDLANSVVHLDVQPDSTLKAVDFFTPYDAAYLDTFDADFGAGGPAALPDQYFGTTSIPHLMVQAGKEGYVYLLNRDSLGGAQQGAGRGDAVVGRIGPYGGVWSKPAVWPGDGGWIYIPTSSQNAATDGSAGYFRIYQYGLNGNGVPAISLAASSTDLFGFSSSSAIITSDGTTSGSALVWIVWAPDGTGVGGQLRAYDAVPQNGKPTLRFSTPIGTASKFVPPGVDAGRLYVGTRDGHIICFGASVTPPLTGATVSFPATSIGQSTTRTATLTAAVNLTLNSLTSSNPQYTLGTSTPALPAALNTGQTVTVPITFAPTQTGLVAATLTASTTVGSVQFGLNGVGQSPTAHLSASPSVLSFGGTAIGGVLTSSVTLSNTGGAPLTITGVTAPSVPFAATATPAVGSILNPGQSVVATVTFSPTVVGTYNDQLSVTSTGGNAIVQLTGNATLPGVLQVTPLSLDYGGVNVGATKSLSFTVANTGGTSITITKSKPPSLGQFISRTTLAEGSNIAAGSSVTMTVQFGPTTAGSLTDTWVINSDGQGGLQTVTFTGVGNPSGLTVIPDPVLGGWQINGSASLLGSTPGSQLQLTPALTSKAGSAFWPVPVSSANLTIAFDMTIDSGDPAYGADGAAFVLADPASGAKPTSLGANGGGIGCSGIPGNSIAFETYPNSTAGIADNGTDPTADWLSYEVQTSTGVPQLRNSTHHVQITVSAGSVTLNLDGVHILTKVVALPANVLVGFSGSTGPYLYDRHAVSNVSITSGAAPAMISVSPGSLPLGNVNTGSQASGKVTFSNSGGSTLTVTGSTLPAAPFTVTGLPANGTTLTGGQSVTATVTFAPTAAGTFTDQLVLSTSAGSATVSLSGTGVAPPPAKLTANPTSTAFGSATTGTTVTKTMQFSNTGGLPLTVNSSTLPAAPFTATGVPAAGTVLAAGQAVTVTLTFAPTAAGTFSDQLILTTTAGTATVPLSGTGVAPAPANLVASPTTISFGSIGVGGTATQTIKYSNTGGLPLTINSSTLPAAPFKITGVPAGGIILNGGQSFTATATFSPTTTGPFSDQVTVVSSAGTVSVPLSGSGVPSGSTIPDPVLGGWQINGSASLLGSTPGSQLQLTPALTSKAGSAFWPVPVSSANLTIAFDMTIDSGDPAYGADGAAFVLADPASGAKPTSLGANGGGIGCSGIPGNSIAFETYPNSMAGIADNGTDPTADWLSYEVQTSTGVPQLRNSTHHVQITVVSGIITLTVDSTKIFSKVVALPANVLVGFSGSTGPYLYDRHAVSNVAITVH